MLGAKIVKPCYELVVASLRLLQRQLLELFEESACLLIFVGAAEALVPSLEAIFAARNDALPLAGEVLPDEDDAAAWQLPPNAQVCVESRLSATLDEVDEELLHEVRKLQQLLPRKRRRI